MDSIDLLHRADVANGKLHDEGYASDDSAEGKGKRDGRTEAGSLATVNEEKPGPVEDLFAKALERLARAKSNLTTKIAVMNPSTTRATRGPRYQQERTLPNLPVANRTSIVRRRAGPS